MAPKPTYDELAAEVERLQTEAGYDADATIAQFERAEKAEAEVERLREAGNA